MSLETRSASPRRRVARPTAVKPLHSSDSTVLRVHNEYLPMVGSALEHWLRFVRLASACVRVSTGSSTRIARPGVASKFPVHRNWNCMFCITYREMLTGTLLVLFRVSEKALLLSLYTACDVFFMCLLFGALLCRYDVFMALLWTG